jgi:hypothetical protein
MINRDNDAFCKALLPQSEKKVLDCFVATLLIMTLFVTNTLHASLHFYNDAFRNKHITCVIALIIMTLFVTNTLHASLHFIMTLFVTNTLHASLHL